jgi:hypothetical protein
MAEIIRDDFVDAIFIAQGDYDWNDIESLVEYEQFPDAKSRDSDYIFPKDLPRAKRGIWLWNQVVEKAKNSKSSFVSLPKFDNYWNEFKEGYVTIDITTDPDRFFKYDDNVQCEPINSTFTNKDGTEINIQIFKKCYAPEETQYRLWKLYISDFLLNRSFYGGDPDPLFWNPKYNKFKEIDYLQVGIVKVDGYLPKPVEEYREIIKKRDVDRLRYWRLTDEEHEMVNQGNMRRQGFEVMSAMSEVRLAKNRFNKLEML